MASRSIGDVAGQIGKDWYMVGVQLGYSHSQLDHLEEIYQSRPLQRNHVMLSKWKQQVEKEGLDCKLVLAAHLQESGNQALAENLAPNIATENINTRIHEENLMVKLDNAIKEINFDVKTNQESDFVTCKIKRLLNCPKCAKPFHQPKQLPCWHTLCRRCIVALLEENQKNCPICKDCLDLDKDVDLYAPNLLINDLIAINSKYEPLSSNEPSAVLCELCSERKSVHFCVDCLKYMCQACTSLHSKLPALKYHVTYEVTSENSPIIELRKKVPRCAKHGHEVASFCVGCHMGVCENCRETCPKNHAFEDLHTHCLEKRKEIDKFVKSSDDMLRNYSLAAYDERKHKMTKEKDNALKELESIFSAARDRLEENASNLKSKVEDKYNRKCLEMDSERKSIREDKMKLSSRIEYLKFLSEYGSDAHIVTECNTMNDFSEVKPSIENLRKFEVVFQRNPAFEDTIVHLNFGELEDYYILDENESYNPKQQNNWFESEEENYFSKDDEQSLNELDMSDDTEEYDDFANDDFTIREEINDTPRKEFPQLRQLEKPRRFLPLPDISPKPRRPPPLPHIPLKPRRPPPLPHIPPKGYETDEIYSDLDDDICTVDLETSTEDTAHRYQIKESRPPPPPPIPVRFPPKYIHKSEISPYINAEKSKLAKAQCVNVTLLHDFHFAVSGMAASDEDIALISQESRCIKIFHFKKKTVSMVTSECKRIAAPFDAVYSKDKDQVTGLYFTETDEKKKGVKIVYRKKSKLKLVDFTNRVEDPRGISANDQNIFVCDKTRQSIFVFKKDGEMILAISKRNSRFDLPLYVFADGNERLFISDSKTNSVQELSGIDYGCQVIKQLRHSDFQLKEKMVLGKCCVNNDIFIPDRKSRKLLNCRTKENIYLSETPVAVAMLNSSEIVVATYEGKSSRLSYRHHKEIRSVICISTRFCIFHYVMFWNCVLPFMEIKHCIGQMRLSKWSWF